MTNSIHTKHLKKTICLLMVMLGAFTAGAQELRSPAHLGLFYPLSSNGRMAGQYTNGFSFHLLMGLSREERSFALSGVSTVIKENASGIQISGVSNFAGNRTKGLQFAGVYNHTGEHLRGLQIAGVVNNADTTHGTQLAGVLNRAGDVKGMQIAGVANIAGKVKGLQFAGIVNIADSSDYPVALLNFIKNGEKSIGLATDETFNLLASFRSGGRVLYGILEIGYNLKSDDDLYALGAGLGAHIVFSDRFRVNTELKSLILDDFHRGDYSKYSLNILPAFRISEKWELFAGPSLNFVDTDMQAGKALFKHPIWEKENGQGNLRQWYVGASAGVHFIL